MPPDGRGKLQTVDVGAQGHKRREATARDDRPVEKRQMQQKRCAPHVVWRVHPYADDARSGSVQPISGYAEEVSLDGVGKRNDHASIRLHPADFFAILKECDAPLGVGA